MNCVEQVLSAKKTMRDIQDSVLFETDDGSLYSVSVEWRSFKDYGKKYFVIKKYEEVKKEDLK